MSLTSGVSNLLNLKQSLINGVSKCPECSKEHPSNFLPHSRQCKHFRCAGDCNLPLSEIAEKENSDVETATITCIFCNLIVCNHCRISGCVNWCGKCSMDTNPKLRDLFYNNPY